MLTLVSSPLPISPDTPSMTEIEAFILSIKTIMPEIDAELLSAYISLICEADLVAVISEDCMGLT